MCALSVEFSNMKLIDLVTAVQEPNLTKEQIEAYYDAMAGLQAQIIFEKANLEKQQALFIATSYEKSAVAKKNAWNATPDGQRLIELKNYADLAKHMTANLKNRTYRLI